MLRPPGAWSAKYRVLVSGSLALCFECKHGLAAVVLDGAHGVRASVQGHLVADVRQPLEREPARDDELPVLVGPVDAGDLAADHPTRTLPRRPSPDQGCFRI